MKVKKQKSSVAEKILKVVNEKNKTAEEIQKELKDKYGFSIKSQDIRVNLLYLLRREKIQRTKEDDAYKYHL